MAGVVSEESAGPSEEDSGKPREQSEVKALGASEVTMSEAFKAGDRGEDVAAGAEKAEKLVQHLKLGGRTYRYYDVRQLGPEYDQLPYCLRVLAECAVRRGHREAQSGHGAVAKAWKESLTKLMDHKELAGNTDVLFHPGRVALQDFTGVPALADLAALRDAVASAGGDVTAVDSACPADLVVDHSVQLDYAKVAGAARAAAERKRRDEELRQVKLEAPGEQQPQPPPSTVVVHSAFATVAAPAAFYTFPAAPADPQVAPVAFAAAPPFQLQPMTPYYPVNAYAAPPYYEMAAPQYAVQESPAFDDGDDDEDEKDPDGIPTDNPGMVLII